ncbi:MAG: sulfur carrier protein ThiS [Candidatus Hydrogenedentota bacterium]
MKVKINGNIEEVANSLTIFELLKSKEIKNLDGIVCEYNGRILKKELWDKTLLNGNDRIEFIQFIGGG